MPTPGKDEKEKDFISRCIPIVLEDGTAKDNKQATAICYEKWREKHGGEKPTKKTASRRIVPRPITAVRSDDGVERYKCYGVLFGDEDNLDCYGTYFDADTNYYMSWFDKRPWLYHHGMHPLMGLEQIGEWIEDGIDEEGIFLVGELLESFKHKEAVKELIKARVLYPSQGTLGYAMDMDWKTGHIIDWPLIEISSTVRPANLQQQAISLEVGRAIRALQGGISMEQGTETPIQEGLTEAPPQSEPPVESTPIVPATAADTDSREAISQLAQAVTAVDQGLKDLHSELREVRSIIDGLSQSEANRMKDLVTGKTWLEGLWSVSRQGEPMGEGETAPSPFIHVAPTPDKGGVGLLASIFEQA